MNHLELAERAYEEQLNESFKLRDSIDKYRQWIGEAQDKLQRISFSCKILDEQINYLLDSHTLLEKSKRLKVPKNVLRLPLKSRWFKMTRGGIKKEDYREINEYWCHRLLERRVEGDSEINWPDVVNDLLQKREDALSAYGLRFKAFTENLMTLGYPKTGDLDRMFETEHEGIEIRTGYREWGAEPNKIYFVIKHKRIK